MKLIEDWKKGLRLYSTRFHIIGLIFSATGTGLALLYGAQDSVQHAMLPTWITYPIFFFIFVGAFIGRFIKQ